MTRKKQPSTKTFFPAGRAVLLLFSLFCLQSGDASYHREENTGDYGDGGGTPDFDKLEHQSFDGRNNNKRWPEWGATKTRRVRKFPNVAGFLEGTNDTPLDENNTPGLPSARRIMEELFRKVPPKPDKDSSAILLAMGEFIAQDIVMFSTNDTESFDVPCDGELNDLVYCPGTGQQYNITESIPFHRLVSGTRNGVRATINEQTAYLDLSNVYGISEEDANRRRAAGGKMALDEEGLFPEDKIAWVSGNKSPSSYALMVVFARYHNLIASNWADRDPSLSDDDIFHIARRRTIAVYQQLVEEKYLPFVVGDRLNAYSGYDESVDPAIDEFFAAVAFRYGHSSLPSVVRMLDEKFDPMPSSPLLLRDIFAQPPPNHVQALVKRYGGVEPFLRGLVTVPSKAIDLSFADDLNIYTSATAVKDIQRGRDVGIPRYNDVREAMGRGRSRLQSMEELANGNPVALEALRSLYDDNVNLVDAYVGALLEDTSSYLNPLAPTLTWSIKDQFERIRDGDRYWYKNLYTAEEYSEFPSFSGLIRLVCSDMELFPDEPFSVFYPGVSLSDDDASCSAASQNLNQLSLLGGVYKLGWSLENYSIDDPASTIDISLSVREAMDGPGFIGVGWRRQQMQGAHIWWCTVDADVFESFDEPEVCNDDLSSLNTQEAHVFSCCLSIGGFHFIPPCTEESDPVFYPLEVLSSCVSPENSVVKIRAPVCTEDSQLEEGGTRDCFELSSESDGSIDFIVSYNLLAPNRPHGFQRRTKAQVDLRAGILTQAEAGVADDGLIATHGVFMLIAWMILAPWAIFIVRYFKTYSWWQIAHVSLMGICGSLLVPMIIGVEASVGASDKTADHALVGIILTCAFFVMAFAGRIRLLKHSGVLPGKRTDFWTFVIHKYGGYTFLGLAWWNCYTGLVRISPEDSFVQVVVFSSQAFGYDLPVFGIIRQYVYGPYIAFVLFVFAVAEVRKRWLHAQNVEKVLTDTGTIWDDKDEESDLEPMSMETFLDVTRLGSALCIVDGRVLDITDFINIHPGGPDLLKYVRGSDITDELLGRRDVDGVKHCHSGAALKLLRKFVKARIVDTRSSGEFVAGSSEMIAEEGGRKNRFTRVSTISTSKRGIYRRGKVVGVEYLTPNMPSSDSSRPVILLRLSLPKTTVSDDSADEDVMLPGTVYVFRGIDERGNMFDRQYTPVQIKRNNVFRDYSITMGETVQKSSSTSDQHEIHEFLISLVPNGRMSKFLLNQKCGKVVLVQGPRINFRVLDKVEGAEWKSVVMIAAGTGISPMIQLVNYYLWMGVSEMPNLYLVWNLTSPDHGYENFLGLQELERKSNGKFKWTINYTASGQSSHARPSLMRSVKSKFKDISHWTHKSLTHQKPKRGLLRRVSANQLGPSSRVMNLIAVAEPSPAPTGGGIGSVKIDVNFWTENMHETSHPVTASLLRDVLISTESYTELQEDNEPEGDPGDEAPHDVHSNNAQRSSKAVRFSGQIVETSLVFKNTLVAVSGSPDFETNMIDLLGSEVGLPAANLTLFQMVTEL